MTDYTRLASIAMSKGCRDLKIYEWWIFNFAKVEYPNDCKQISLTIQLPFGKYLGISFGQL